MPSGVIPRSKFRSPFTATQKVDTRRRPFHFGSSRSPSLLCACSYDCFFWTVHFTLPRSVRHQASDGLLLATFTIDAAQFPSANSAGGGSSGDIVKKVKADVKSAVKDCVLTVIVGCSFLSEVGSLSNSRMFHFNKCSGHALFNAHLPLSLSTQLTPPPWDTQHKQPAQCTHISAHAQCDKRKSSP